MTDTKVSVRTLRGALPLAVGRSGHRTLKIDRLEMDSVIAEAELLLLALGAQG